MVLVAHGESEIGKWIGTNSYSLLNVLHIVA